MKAINFVFSILRQTYPIIAHLWYPWNEHSKTNLGYIELLIYRSIYSGPLDFDISEFYCIIIKSYIRPYIIIKSSPAPGKCLHVLYATVRDFFLTWFLVGKSGLKVKPVFGGHLNIPLSVPTGQITWGMQGTFHSKPWDTFIQWISNPETHLYGETTNQGLHYILKYLIRDTLVQWNPTVLRFTNLALTTVPICSNWRHI